MFRIRRYLSFANVVSVTALFVALGGVGYAAITLPKNSVGTTQLRTNAVTGAKIKSGAITSSDVKDRALLARDFKAGQLPAGPAGASGAKGEAGATGATGPTGPDGVAGSARAYAHVTRTAGGDFVLDAARSKNVVNVTLPSTMNDDRPCLILPASIDATTAVAIGGVDTQNTPTSETATVQHRVGGEGSQGCSGNSIALFLKRNGAGSTSDIAFDVMVP